MKLSGFWLIIGLASAPLAPSTYAADRINSFSTCVSAPSTETRISVCTDLLVSGELSSEQRFRALIERARALSKLGRDTGDFEDFALAIADLNEARTIRPDSGEPLLERGRALEGAGRSIEAMSDFEGALVKFDRALEADPNDVSSWFGRALVVLELKRPDSEALADLSAAVRLAPGWSALYRERAKVLVRLRRFDNALRDYDAAIRFEPSDSDLLFRRAVVKMITREPSRLRSALVDLDQAISHGIRSAEAFYMRGRAHAALGNFGRARSDFEEALRINPQHIAAESHLSKLPE